jgi:hypothetical protein
MPIEVHGTLWLLDTLFQHQLLSARECIAILQIWQADPLVFLPPAEIDRRLEGYARGLE